MSDLDLAKEGLEGGESFVTVRKGEILATSKATGISYLVSLYEDRPDLLRGASLADTTIGKAAALFMAEMGVGEVYGRLVSEPALKIFEENGIEISYQDLVPRILNRDRTGFCPMEKLAMDTEDVNLLHGRIKEFWRKNSGK